MVLIMKFRCRNGIFTPDMAFIATVTKIIVRFKDPLKECVDTVGRVLGDVIAKSAELVGKFISIIFLTLVFPLVICHRYVHAYRKSLERNNNDSCELAGFTPTACRA